MTKLEFELEGVTIEISHPTIELRKRKAPIGPMSKFRCQGCGRRTLEITESEIKRAGAFTTKEGEAKIAIFPMVQATTKLDRELKAIENDPSLDFIGYLSKRWEWQKKRRSGFHEEIGLMNAGTSPISIECQLCKTPHKFEITISSPHNVSWDEPNLIDLFDKRGIRTSASSLDLLERIAFKPPSMEHAEEFLKRINTVAEDLKKIQQVVDRLKGCLREGDAFVSEGGQAWIRSLESSLDEVGKMLEKDLKDDLQRYLNTIKDEVEWPPI